MKYLSRYSNYLNENLSSTLIPLLQDLLTFDETNEVEHVDQHEHPYRSLIRCPTNRHLAYGLVALATHNTQHINHNNIFVTDNNSSSPSSSSSLTSSSSTTLIGPAVLQDCLRFVQANPLKIHHHSS